MQLLTLDRFVVAQKDVYSNVLLELSAGEKRSHWMWFIFPQIQGLGSSETAQFFEIQSITEAKSYLNNDILGSRIIECSNLLIKLAGSDIQDILGPPDDLKLNSSMTLFDSLHVNSVFDKVLNLFYNGKRDQKTLSILSSL